MNMAQCPKCGSQHLASQRVCPHCGDEGRHGPGFSGGGHSLEHRPQGTKKLEMATNLEIAWRKHEQTLQDLGERFLALKHEHQIRHSEAAKLLRSIDIFPDQEGQFLELSVRCAELDEQLFVVLRELKAERQSYKEKVRALQEANA